MNIASDVLIASNSYACRSHGTFVATAINSAHMAFQQNDVRHYFQVSLVVTAKDGIHIDVVFGSHGFINIHEHVDEARCGDTVATAIDGANMSARRTTINVYIHKGVALYRSLFVGIAILWNDFVTIFIVVVTVATTIHFLDGGVANYSYIGAHFRARRNQHCISIRGIRILRGEDTVGKLSHLACAVVAAVDSRNGASRYHDIVAAIDVGHVTTAKHIAFNRATIDMDYGPTHSVDWERREIVGYMVAETYRSQVAACIHIAFNGGTCLHNGVCLIVGRHEHSHIVFVGIIDAAFIVEVLIAVVEAVTASKEVFVNGAARGFDVGAALNFLILRSTRCTWVDAGATHVAAHVAAAKHGAYVTILDIHPCAVVHVTHSAAAIEVVDNDVVTIQNHFSAIFEGHIGCVVAVFVDSSIVRSKHVSRIAAAIHRTYATRGQNDRWHAGHVFHVVAAIEIAHIIDALAVPIIFSIGIACRFRCNDTVLIGLDSIGVSVAIGVIA